MVSVKWLSVYCEEKSWYAKLKNIKWFEILKVFAKILCKNEIQNNLKLCDWLKNDYNDLIIEL